MNIGRIVRGALGILIVFVLAIVVYGWYSDFKTAPPAALLPIVGTATQPSVTPSPTAGIAIARIDGVNFRIKPASNAKLIRGLKKNERITILAKEGQWYKAKDSKGVTGWVTASGGYVTIQAK